MAEPTIGQNKIGIIDIDMSHTYQTFAHLGDAHSNGISQGSPKSDSTHNDFKTDTNVSIEITAPEVTSRQRLLTTVLILWNMATTGMVFGQIGPVLPDLQLITGSSLEQVSWLLTGFGVGYITGCLLAGIVLGKVHYRPLEAFSTTGTAIMAAILPWTENIYAAVAIRVAQGIFFGGQDTVNHATLFAIWTKDSGPFCLIMYTIYAAGGIISPLYSKPFIRDPQISGIANNSIFDSTPTSNTTEMTEYDAPGTNVQYAFLITALFTVSAGLPFLFMHIFKCHDPTVMVSVNVGKREEHNLPARVKQLLLVALLAMAFITTATIMVFPNLLTAFVIQQLRWTQQSSAALTSVFYATYCAGNLLGVLSLKVTSTSVLILASYAITIASLVGFMIGSLTNQTMVIWITVAVCGVAMAALIPTVYTWTEENVTHVTGRIASGLLGTGSLGLIFQPMVLGYLMDNKSSMWFIYFTLGEMAVSAILFVISFVVVKVISPVSSEPISQS